MTSAIFQKFKILMHRLDDEPLYSLEAQIEQLRDPTKLAAFNQKVKFAFLNLQHFFKNHNEFTSPERFKSELSKERYCLNRPDCPFIHSLATYTALQLVKDFNYKLYFCHDERCVNPIGCKGIHRGSLRQGIRNGEAYWILNECSVADKT